MFFVPPELGKISLSLISDLLLSLDEEKGRKNSFVPDLLLSLDEEKGRKEELSPLDMRKTKQQKNSLSSRLLLARETI